LSFKFFNFLISSSFSKTSIFDLSSAFELYHLISCNVFIAHVKIEAIIFISFSFIHLVVTAGVQTLIPEGSIAFLSSYGIIFLLADNHTNSSAFSASLPVTQKLENTSIKSK
jgi:hypothetical protein